MQPSPSYLRAPWTRRRRLFLLLCVAIAASVGSTAPPAGAEPTVYVQQWCYGNNTLSYGFYYGFAFEAAGFPVDAATNVVATAQRPNRPAENVEIEQMHAAIGARRLEPPFGRVTVQVFVDSNGNGVADAGEPSARGTVNDPCAGSRAYLYDGALRFFDYDENGQNGVTVTKLGGDFTLADGGNAPAHDAGACYAVSTSYSLCGPSQTEYGMGPPARPVQTVDVRTGGGDDSARIAYSGGPGAYMAGGRGADELTGGAAGDTLVGAEDDPAPGEAGDDPLDGADTLNGAGGADTLIGNLGGDRINGGAGDDHAYGDGGADRISGDSGSDLISGGSGNDTLISRDDVRDDVTCGPGNDSVSADWNDAIAADCESVDRGPAPPQPPPPPPVTPPPPVVTPPPATAPVEVPTTPTVTQPSVPPPPQTGTVQDVTAPVASALVRSSRISTLRRGALKVTVITSEASAIALRLTRGGVLIARGSATTLRAGRKTVKLVPTRAGKRKLRSLRRGTFMLRVTVTDAAGNARNLTKLVALR